jgi:hypothetical protein
MRPRLRNFGLKQDGSTTLEFVVVFIGFIAIMFFVMEVTLYLFFMASLEKAAQAGVRAAVVSRPAVFGFPSTIGASGAGAAGKSCSDPSNPCVAFDDYVCDRGDDCHPGRFRRIVDHMRGFNGQIDEDNVTITYTDVGIGFAGGPTVPMVTVTVRGIPFQTGIAGLLLGDIGDAVLPPRSASMTGEDLAQ